jgi:putative phosphotransacetylase
MPPKKPVDLVTPKGTIKKVRILGPERKTSQVEKSRTDALKLGITVPVRDSGDLDGSPPITLVGPCGTVYPGEGVIAAWRHIHMDPADAAAFGVKDRDLYGSNATAKLGAHLRERPGESTGRLAAGNAHRHRRSQRRHAQQRRLRGK